MGLLASIDKFFNGSDEDRKASAEARRRALQSKCLCGHFGWQHNHSGPAAPYFPICLIATCACTCMVNADDPQ